MRSGLLASLLCLLLAPGLGCFKSSTFQASSESSSDSSRSSSKSSASSSASSSPSSRENPYIADVRDYTKSWTLSGGDEASFRGGLAQIAEKNGITNWEQNDATYEGIGRGLKQAGVSGARLEDLKKSLAGQNPEAPKWIQSGYDKEKVTN